MAAVREGLLEQLFDGSMLVLEEADTSLLESWTLGADRSIIRDLDLIFIIRPPLIWGIVEQHDLSSPNPTLPANAINIERGPAIDAVRCLQRTNRRRYREWYLATHWPDVLEDIFALANRSRRFVRKSRVERYGDVCPGYPRGRRAI